MLQKLSSHLLNLIRRESPEKMVTEIAHQIDKEDRSLFKTVVFLHYDHPKTLRIKPCFENAPSLGPMTHTHSGHHL